MTSRLFGRDYGSGTGVSRAHSDTLDRIEGMTYGQAPEGFPMSTAMKANDGVVIKVDPLGDDSPLNPGTDTPLKTFLEATKRCPVAGQNVIIELAADAEWERKGQAASISGGFFPATVRGTPTVIETFELDAVSGLDASKDSGTPVWITDEHKGRFVIWTHPVYGSEFQHPIISNDAHSLKIAWLPPAAGGVQWPFFDPPLGTTFSIVEMNSVLVTPADFSNFYFGGDWNFEKLRIEGPSFGLAPGGGVRTVNLQACHIANCTRGYQGQQPQFAGFIANLFENISAQAIFGTWGFQGSLMNNYWLNCDTAYYSDFGHLNIVLGTAIFGENMDEILEFGVQNKAYDSSKGVWVENVDRYAVLNRQSSYTKGRDPLAPLETKTLDANVFRVLNGGNEVNFVEEDSANNTLDTAGGTNTLHVDGVDMSWSDYVTGQSKNYADTKGNKVFG